MIQSIASNFVHLFGASFFQDSFRSIIIADWHGAEGFSFNPGNETSNYQEKLSSFQYIKETFGGDIMLLPGDTQSGRWYSQNYREKYFPDLDPEETVLQAGENCYETILNMFLEAGYDKVLVSTGDHEYGGNGWGQIDKNPKTELHDEFKFSFSQGFNINSSTGEFRFSTPIGKVPSVPIGTPYETTSYAYQYMNALFITVDAFHMIGDGTKSYFHRSEGVGGEGVITCTVEGQHLSWFRSVLEEATNIDTIKHTIVQAHLPIIQPVRKVSSSGQFMDHGESSNFWKTMVEYNVDVYLAGEVHANTVTKDPNSNLVQIVSRGNRLNNILTLDAYENVLVFNSYNEIGDKAMYNNNHTLHGTLVIDKTEDEVIIKGEGSLELLNRWDALLYFDFEEIHPINERQVLGLKDNDEFDPETMKIDEIECEDAFWNKGSFQQQYDMQIGFINLDEGILGNAAKFSWESQAAIFAMGPHGPGNIVSYALWIKTNASSAKQILIHYGASFAIGNDDCSKDQFTLTLWKGKPILYRCSKSKLSSAQNLNLADDEWHHIAITMPKDNCLLSEVHMYVDGVKVETMVIGEDEFLFFSTSGRLSVGGFGYTAKIYESVFDELKSYYGLIDELYVWSRKINMMDIKKLIEVSGR